MAGYYTYFRTYLIVAIASDGEIVDHNEVAEEDLDHVTFNGEEMPKGSYITCLAVPLQRH